jgi:hypothetical protein
MGEYIFDYTITLDSNIYIYIYLYIKRYIISVHLVG